MDSIFNIAVFASGTGTTLQALIDNQQEYGYRVAQVVTNRTCIAFERAQAAAIPTLQSKDWKEIDQVLTENHIQLIVLAGFLAIINIHPSLLPKHGGKGMYGVRVQEAVLAVGDRMAGCTVHYVSAEVDGGSIIAQATVAVEDNDTAETLAQRVQIEEKQLLPQVIGELKKNIKETTK